MMHAVRGEVNNDHSLEELESYLEETLSPVEPRPVFVSYLRTRLSRVKTFRKTISKGMKVILLTLAGLISGVVVIISSARLIIVILGAIGLLRQASSKARQKNNFSNQTVG